LELPFVLPKPLDEKDVFWHISGMMAPKNEVRILTEPARGAQFGKSRGEWQNVYRLHF
jgi:hypothetical protein